MPCTFIVFAAAAPVGRVFIAPPTPVVGLLANLMLIVTVTMMWRREVGPGRTFSRPGPVPAHSAALGDMDADRITCTSAPASMHHAG